MGKITYKMGEEHLLATYFQNTPESFGPFYIGLGIGPAPLIETTTLADLVELSGTGYTRKQVTRDATATGWVLATDTVTSPTLVFSNTDLIDPWDTVDFVFLCLSPSGSTVDPTLIAAVDLVDSVTAAAGQDIKVVFKFRQRTTFSHPQRRMFGEGNLSGVGGITATATVS